MNSIRPLATITLLAVAGVYLYFKINETEPQLPADVADWSLPAEVDIHDQPVPENRAVTSGYPAPTSTNPVQEAPSFTPEVALPASVPNASMTSPNPGQQTGPIQAAPGFQATATPMVTQGAPTHTTLPDLPPLPEIPAATSAQSSPPGTPPEVIRETPAAAGSHQGHDHRGVETQSLPVASATAGQTPIATSPQASLFGATRLAVQGALDRGELSQALLLLSDWYGDPSLAPAEKQEVDALLSQLAGSVIYSTEHRLEPSYRVQAGERLEDIAKKYNVPWQLLAKINGLERPDQLQPGQELKVVRGPFSALIDLGDRQLTVMLARRYAGKFTIDIDPQVSVEEGQWKVDQKLVTPSNLNMASSGSVTTSGGNGGSVAMEEQSLVLTSTASRTAQIAILKGSESVSSSVATEPENRVIRMKTADVRDVFDILSVGSNVIIRR